jgi:hypothetical protein
MEIIKRAMVASSDGLLLYAFNHRSRPLLSPEENKRAIRVEPSLLNLGFAPAKTPSDGPRPGMPSECEHLRRFLPSVEMTIGFPFSAFATLREKFRALVAPLPRQVVGEKLLCCRC